MRVGPTLKKLQKTYGKNIRFVYKHFVVHPTRATLPAQAACAAQRQRKFMKMYDAIFSMYGQYSQAQLDKHARKIRLNMKKFHKDMTTHCKTRVQAERVEMAKFGTRGAPSFFINGRYLSGNRPFSHFKVLVDEVLAKAKRSRIRPSQYYKKVIMTLGKPSL